MVWISWIFIFVFAGASVHPSLKEFGAGLKKSDEIESLFQQSLVHPEALSLKKVLELEKVNRQLFRDFRNLVEESATFLRGEIAEESCRQNLFKMLDLSLLRVRFAAQEKGQKMSTRLGRIKEELGLWFRFAADLPYNESTLLGLQFAGQIRSRLIDELERLEQQLGPEMSEDELWFTWAMQLRTPWPIDRIVLSESRLLLNGDTKSLGERVAIKLQKDPYLSVERALKQISGKKQVKTQELEVLWTDQNIEQMKSEVNRLQKLRLKLAARLYLHRKGKWPADVQTLVKEKYFLAAPIDYSTGLAMQLPQEDKPSGAGKSP